MAGKVITVAQQKGGSGKTTLAAHLALGFRAEGKTVALIDLDPQGSLGRWYVTRFENDEASCEGLEFSTSSAWGISMEVRKMANACDIVIVDTPPKVDSDLRPALRVAHLVVVPVSAGHMDLWATEGVMDLAARENRPILLVMNRTRAGTRLGAEVNEAAKQLGAPVAEAMIAQRVGYAEAMGHGRGALEMRGPAREEIAALVAEVAERLNAG
ncbi:AAA family ATPase [Sagittula sp. NFXS13]|uniref:Chromosome partitioning protein n=1 Tax=Sagittula marina TaxID=943940 RepID=A0A7W6DNL7_9RHOB|nr:ParA family partition ATPase [Sagittula marina]MBB3984836.1 chromosome partitioning protein [Sagittula marina]